jgi:hypothetical protein
LAWEQVILHDHKLLPHRIYPMLRKHNIVQKFQSRIFQMCNKIQEIKRPYHNSVYFSAYNDLLKFCKFAKFKNCKFATFKYCKFLESFSAKIYCLHCSFRIYFTFPDTSLHFKDTFMRKFSTILRDLYIGKSYWSNN